MNLLPDFVLRWHMPHLLLSALLAIVVSGLIAMLGDRMGRERIWHALYLWCCCMGSVIGAGWLMRFVHG